MFWHHSLRYMKLYGEVRAFWERREYHANEFSPLLSNYFFCLFLILLGKCERRKKLCNRILYKIDLEPRVFPAPWKFKARFVLIRRLNKRNEVQCSWMRLLKVPSINSTLGPKFLPFLLNQALSLFLFVFWIEPTRRWCAHNAADRAWLK